MSRYPHRATFQPPRFPQGRPAVAGADSRWASTLPALAAGAAPADRRRSGRQPSSPMPSCGSARRHGHGHRQAHRDGPGHVHRPGHAGGRGARRRLGQCASKPRRPTRALQQPALGGHAGHRRQHRHRQLLGPAAPGRRDGARHAGAPLRRSAGMCRRRDHRRRRACVSHAGTGKQATFGELADGRRGDAGTGEVRAQGAEGLHADRQAACRASMRAPSPTARAPSRRTSSCPACSPPWSRIRRASAPRCKAFDPARLRGRPGVRYVVRGPRRRRGPRPPASGRPRRAAMRLKIEWDETRRRRRGRRPLSSPSTERWRGSRARRRAARGDVATALAGARRASKRPTNSLISRTPRWSR